MRRHLYDLLSTNIIDPYSEALKLDDLLSTETPLVYNGLYTTLEKYIDEVSFRSLQFRGTCTSINEIRKYLKVGHYDLDRTLEKTIPVLRIVSRYCFWK